MTANEDVVEDLRRIISMTEKNFKDALENENVEADAGKIVPSLAGNKRRLEVAKIAKVISEEADLNFDMTTDEDVFAALSKKLKTSDMRLVFQACAESVDVECDEEKLARLTKPRILALFFHVFDVYPAANPPVDNTTKDAPSTEKNFDAADEYFDQVFPNFKRAADLKFSAVEKFLPAEFRKIKSGDELKLTLSEEKIPEGKIVRDFVEQAIKAANVEYDEQALRALRRNFYLPLFFRAINFIFDGKQEKFSPPPVDDDEKISGDEEIIRVSFQQFKGIFDAAKKIDAADLDFDISDTLKIFEGNSVTVKDKFHLNIPDDKKILRGLVGIASTDGKIAAVGHIEDGLIEEHGSKKFLPHMVFDWNMIRKDELVGRKTFQAVLFPLAAKDFFARPMSQSLAENFSGEVWTLEFNIAYSALEVTDRPLCIDFGTSNTTAGTYDLREGGEPKLVTFRDVTSEKIIDREILPTIVYVESCRDGIVNFKYGYEAKQEIIAANYDTRASVFYEIKRWINSLDEVEEVVGADGRETARITRREILRKYLLYVIREAEQQYKVKFKRLHLTAPVKLRKKFLYEMKKIFKPEGYDVEEKSLDEGVAIVYHHIAKLLKADKEVSGKVLILDCGGGTTDLASCEFSIEQGNDWPILRLQTDFESGDSNFGGNNITYRILQMLKMKIAANLQRNENFPMQDLIPEEDDDILSLIDYAYEKKNEIYKRFEEEYDRAEDFIPTKFAEYTMKNERLKVKRNFYYLWQLAEAIKIEFFKSAKVNVDFEKDKKIFVAAPEEYYLNVRRDGKLQSEAAPMEGVEITIREITRIILPDLYALLKTLLNHYREGELLNYAYRLSGQSCKINKFRDLFKEFVPGKIFRKFKDGSRKEIARQKDSVVLKKYCILGSIEYVRDARALGHYQTRIEEGDNRQIYSVNINVNGNETVLLGRGGELELKKFPFDTTDAEFLVRNENNEIERRILYHFNDSKPDYYPLDEVVKLLAKESGLKEEKVNNSIGDALRDVTLLEYNGERQPIVCLAALDSTAGYGFDVWQIFVTPDKKTGGLKYWIPKANRFRSYEDEDLKTFFNGDK